MNTYFIKCNKCNAKKRIELERLEQFDEIEELITQCCGKWTLNNVPVSREDTFTKNTSDMFGAGTRNVSDKGTKEDINGRIGIVKNPIKKP